MSVLGDLGVGSTDLETWTNMGIVGIRLGQGGAQQSQGHRTGRTGVSQADLSLALGWAGIPGPLWAK